jgi:DNA invertase Pin-like site-specific DNA recombinase
MFSMLAVFAEFERNVIAERTQAGLKIARARGRVGGRPKVDSQKIKYAIELYYQKIWTASDIYRITGVRRNTLYRYLRKISPEDKANFLVPLSESKVFESSKKQKKFTKKMRKNDS